MKSPDWSIAFYDSRKYDEESFTEANKNFFYNIEFFDFHLNEKTASTAKGFEVVCPFVNDTLNDKVIGVLKDCGVKLIALRCAGYNNVDLKAAAKAGIKVVRVPAYSPHSVAEHGVALLMALTRHIPQAYARTRTGNFTRPSRTHGWNSRNRTHRKNHGGDSLGIRHERRDLRHLS